MMSSAIPSEKYSCSGSPLILVNARTAIEGLSGNGKASPVSCTRVRSTDFNVAAGLTKKASTGRAMFFRLSGPSSSKARSSRSMHMIAHCSRNADTTRWTFGLKPCRYIHRVPVQVGPICNGVADVDPDAKSNGRSGG